VRPARRHCELIDELLSESRHRLHDRRIVVELRQPSVGDIVERRQCRCKDPPAQPGRLCGAGSAQWPECPGRARFRGPASHLRSAGWRRSAASGHSPNPVESPRSVDSPGTSPDGDSSGGRDNRSNRSAFGDRDNWPDRSLFGDPENQSGRSPSGHRDHQPYRSPSDDCGHQSDRSPPDDLGNQSEAEGSHYGDAELNPDHDAHGNAALNPNHDAHGNADADQLGEPDAFPDGQSQPNTCTESDIERAVIATSIGGLRLGAGRDDARRA